MNVSFFVLALAILFCGVIGAALGRTKGRGAGGCLLGCLFGPLGWIIVLLLPTLKDDSDPITPEFLARRQLSSAGKKAKDDAWKKAQGL